MTTERYSTPTDDKELLEFCKDISRKREKDVQDFDNLTNIFISGRKVAKIPSSSSDVTGNNIGDFNYDSDYLYVCVNNSGNAAWRRVAIGAF